MVASWQDDTCQAQALKKPLVIAFVPKQLIQVWTAATETEDTSSMDKAIEDFTRVIMKDLRKRQIF